MSWTCDCGHENDNPSLDDLLYLQEDNCKECGQVFAFDVRDLVPHFEALMERVERLERRTRNPFEGIDL